MDSHDRELTFDADDAVLRKLEFKLLESCDMQCIYCANDDGINSTKKRQLPLHAIKDILDAGVTRGLSEVSFTGGEPTLSLDSLIAAVAHASRKGVRTQVNTNGTSLTRDNLRALADAGLSVLHISFDTLNEGLFNRIRGFPGSGVYKTTRQNLEMAAQNKLFEVYVEPTVTTLNLDELCDLYTYFVGLGVSVCDIQPLIPVGRATWSLMPDPSRLADALQKLFRQEVQNTRIFVWCQYTPRCRFPQADLSHFVGCRCGRETAYIATDGEIHICSFSQRVGDSSVGNIFVDGTSPSRRFFELWSSARFLKMVRSELPDLCRTCNDLNICHNTCMLIAFQEQRSFSVHACDIIHKRSRTS